MVHPVAERLDILLSLLLSYVKDVCYVDGKPLIVTIAAALLKPPVPQAMYWVVFIH